MQREVVEMLRPGQNGIYVDATIGLGGHAENILRLIGSEGKLIGIDRDEDALRIVKERLSDRKLIMKRGSFSEMEALLLTEGISEIDGILFDLGVSMLQLKDQERGFSFFSHQRLDMRMDRRQRLSAWDVVNIYPEKELQKILQEFGEEKKSRMIAREIVRQRKKHPINTCAELSEILEGISRRWKGLHPATKTFQALRIEVNRELEQLKEGLNAGLRLLKKGGRICVISYHSLEDRIVKHFISENAKKGMLKVITKKPRTPCNEEIRLNPSSRSAKMRGAERT
jgi:16S rRNA (cytosine1402-N4)-methyltransferase